MLTSRAPTRCAEKGGASLVAFLPNIQDLNLISRKYQVQIEGHPTKRARLIRNAKVIKHKENGGTVTDGRPLRRRDNQRQSGILDPKPDKCRSGDGDTTAGTPAPSFKGRGPCGPTLHPLSPPSSSPGCIRQSRTKQGLPLPPRCRCLHC